MSQKAVEGLLGRLLTDPAFRHWFYAEPAASCLKEGLDVTTRELEAILVVDEAQFDEFGKQLDLRIVRAAVRRDLSLSRIRSKGAEPRPGRIGALK
jgi:predicted DNA-binding protein (UPF0251 family)